MASVFDHATSNGLHIEPRASVRQGRDISLIVLLWLLLLSISLLKARRQGRDISLIVLLWLLLLSISLPKARRKLADRPAATSASQHKVSREARGGLL